MADLTPEQISALLDEKLRPINAKLDEHSRKLDYYAQRWQPLPVESGGGFSIKLLVLVLVLAAVAAAVVLIGRTILTGAPLGSSQASAPAATKLVYSDDFSNAAGGLFLDRQMGTAKLPPDGITSQYDYAYQDGMLISHITAPTGYLAGRVIGTTARAANRLSGDFAVEVRARAGRPSASAIYGLRFIPGSREFGFAVRPSQKSYQLWEIFQPPFVAARSSQVAADEQENLLRLEVRGNSLRLFVNGQEVDGRDDAAFAPRPASVGVFFGTVAAPNEPPVTVNFTSFKVYAVGS